jgi:CPA2 family monovalent cation:H+ antiporter-2
MDQLLREILILAGASTVFVSLCLHFNIPSIVGFILTGMFVGPSGLMLVTGLPDVKSLTEWVGMLLMFTIGLEFNRQKILELKHQLLRLGPLQVLGTIGMAMLGGHFFSETSWRSHLVWGLLLSLSSTALVLKLLHDNRDTRSPHGQNSLGILVLQDIAVIPMLITLPLLARSTSSGAEFQYVDTLFWLGKAILLVTTSLVVGRYFLPLLLATIVRRRSQELFFFAILFVGVASGEAFHAFGLSASLGAFVAGLMIAESDFGHHTASIFVPLRDALLGLFFASVGTLIDFGFFWEQRQAILLLALGGFLCKSLVLFGVCQIFKTSAGTAVMTALTLAQVGEFSFILAARAVELGLMTKSENQFFMTISALSMVATPFLYRISPYISRLSFTNTWSDVWANLKPKRLAKSLLEQLSKPEDPPRQQLSESALNQSQPAISPTIIIGFGIAGQNVAQALESLGVPIQVIEMNYTILKQKKRASRHMHFGDATKSDVLRHAGISRARLVVITVSSDTSIPRIIEVIRQERPDIEIIVRVQFVRQAQSLKVDSRTRVIVAEVETALELLSEVLTFYGAEEQLLSSLVAEARQTITAVSEIGADRDGNLMSMPQWALGPSLTPFRVSSNDFICGKSLGSLNLPQNAGVSVAVIFREGLGAAVPHGDFTIVAGDVLHLLIVGGEDRRKVQAYLHSGAMVAS